MIHTGIHLDTHGYTMYRGIHMGYIGIPRGHIAHTRMHGMQTINNFLKREYLKPVNYKKEN
jgi:hypothetical protein